MESAKYFILVGTLLLVMAISPGILKRAPFTSSIVYLLFGILLGRHGLNLIGLHPLDHTVLIEVLSEITVIISLFTVGLKIHFPITDKRWRVPLSLATFSMVFTVGLVAALAHFFLDMELGQSILLGAIAAPTDPVLASEVQLDGPRDPSRKKFILTAEGGLNDGTAFPFVMLGLFILSGNSQAWTMSEWIFKDLLWRISGGVAIGCLCGIIISQIAEKVHINKKNTYLEDFITISSIALSYGMALQFHTYGFLAVFANALTIRQIESKKSNFLMRTFKQDLSDKALSFNEQLERIFEFISVSLVGLLIDLRSLTWDCAFVAIAIFLVIRPLSIFLGTSFSDLSFREKSFLSWFGVRGIGSIYYLYYAINHSSFMGDRDLLIKYTLWIIFFSIVIHGSSVKMVMKRWKN